MKTSHKLIHLAGLALAALAVGSASGADPQLIIKDDYEVTGSGSGFALGSGLNSGINPPATRLTGTAAYGLRYIKTDGTRADTTFTIATNVTAKFDVVRDSGNTATVQLSAGGTTPFDFSTALGTLAAAPTNKSSYDVTIKMRNRGGGTGTAKFSFAIASQPGTAGTWNFGLQMCRTNATDTYYVLNKRISTGASGLAAALTANIAKLNAGTWNTEIAFLFRVTDAGPETTTFNSRIQVSMDGGSTWFYDSSTDPELTSGWRLNNTGRYFIFDIAGTSATYDDFSVTWTGGPPPPPPGTVRTWTGGGADDNWGTGDNWGGTAPISGDMLIFNGTTRQANLNNLSGLTVPWVTFNNGGFTLAGTAWTNTSVISNLAGINTLAGDVAWGLTSSKMWSIASGSELVLNNTNTVDVNGDHTLVGGGTLRLKKSFIIGQATNAANPAFNLNDGQVVVDGGTFTSRGGYRIGSLPAGIQTLLTNGATMNLTVAAANLRVGNTSNAETSRLVIDHSTLNMAAGQLYIPYAAGATGVVSQVGGTVSGCRVNFGDNGAALGSYTNKDGTLEALQIFEGASSALSYMYFDNAVLRALYGATNAFMTGLNLAEIQAGGLTIDTRADVTIAQKLTGAGALTKTGSYALTLTGANTYAGNTYVNAGKLVIGTGRSYGTVQVANSAALGVLLQSQSGSLSNNTLTLAGGASLSFDLSTFPNPTNALLNVANLSAAGTVNIELKKTGVGLATGTILLVDYDGAIGGGADNFLNGTLTLPDGVFGYLVNNETDGRIELVLTAVPGYRWTGAYGGSWDFSTPNWINKQDGSESLYGDGYVTEFGDEAATGQISINDFPGPSAIVVTNDTLPYIWSGGNITTPLVKKYGTNSVVRMGGEADFINAIEINAGSYIFSNLYPATFSTVLSDASAGLGTFGKLGPGTLTVTSSNSTFDGHVVIQEGLVKMGNDRSLGSSSASITIASGATLDLNDKNPGAQPVTVSGDGVNGQGAIIDSTTGGAVDTNLRDVTMVGDTTFGSSGRWDLRARSSTGAGPGLRGNGYKLTKVGSGSVSVACQRNLGAATPYWQMNLGDILIKQGTLTFAESLTPGNPSAALTINTNATLNLYDLNITNPLLRNITMTSARLTCGGSATDTNVIDGSIDLTGPNTFQADQAKLIVNGAITGSGSLGFYVNDPGMLVLNGINTYPGDTTITNGTLSGNGTIAGNLVMLGGTNAPGWPGLGALTVNGNATLAGTTRMKLNRSLSPNSDRLVVGGTLAFGGVLKVVLASGAPSPQAGDVYQLFSKGSATTFTTVSLPSLAGLPGGLAWDTSNLAVNGTIAVTGTAAPPVISSVGLDGGNLVFSGTNGGTEGSTYYVLSSTNAAAPLAEWLPVSTNVFGPGGSFSVTNSVDPAAPQAFFRMQVP